MGETGEGSTYKGRKGGFFSMGGFVTSGEEVCWRRVTNEKFPRARGGGKKKKSVRTQAVFRREGTGRQEKKSRGRSPFSPKGEEEGGRDSLRRQTSMKSQRAAYRKEGRWAVQQKKGRKRESTASRPGGKPNRIREMELKGKKRPEGKERISCFVGGHHSIEQG